MAERENELLMRSPSVQRAEQMERQRMEGLDKCGGHQSECVCECVIFVESFFCLFFLNSHSKHGSPFRSFTVGSIQLFEASLEPSR